MRNRYQKGRPIDRHAVSTWSLRHTGWPCDVPDCHTPADRQRNGKWICATHAKSTPQPGVRRRPAADVAVTPNAGTPLRGAGKMGQPEQPEASQRRPGGVVVWRCGLELYP